MASLKGNAKCPMISVVQRPAFVYDCTYMYKWTYRNPYFP